MRAILTEIFLDAQELLAEGNTQLAIKTYKAALAEARKGTSEEFQALNFLAMAYDDAGNEVLAIETFRMSQQVASQVWGTGSPEYATAVGNEGMVHCNRNRLIEAEAYLDRAVAIVSTQKKLRRSRKAEGTNRCIVEIFANAADCKGKLGKVHDALQLAQHSYEVAQETLPENDRRRLQAGMELVMILGLMGRSEEAESLNKRLLCGALQSDLHPVDAMGALLKSFENTAGMLQGLDRDFEAPPGIRATQHKAHSRSKKRGKAPNGRPARAPSNVISLFPESPLESSAGPPALTPDGDTASGGYQMKITLKGVKPALWRRIVVSTSCSLGDLHYIIQRAMGWTDSHLHEFRFGRSRFGDRSQIRDAKDEESYELADFELQVGSKFEYEYDFGDGWVHTIEIEKLLDETEYAESDTFITGKGACPPEDCGGPYGFMHLLMALKESSRDQLPDWLEEYDPTELPDVFPKRKAAAAGRKK